MTTRRSGALSQYTGEFTDRKVEQSFRSVELPSTARELRIAIVVASLLVLMFGITDYNTLGLTESFYWLIAMRLVVSLILFGFAGLIVARPQTLEQDWPLNAVMVILTTMIILIVPLRPDTAGMQHSAIVVAVIILYLYIPNRLVWQTTFALYLCFGFLLACLLVTDLSIVRMTAMAMLLLMVNVAGYLTALRLNRLRREQFAMLLDQRETNLRLMDEVEQSRRMEKQLRQMAQTDDLTGLCNRRYFLEQAELKRQQCRENGTPLALCMIDLDHFKSINDRLGHAVGDQVLREVARICQQQLRQGDLIGRLGGEEFVIALPGASSSIAEEVAERLRHSIEALRLPDMNSMTLSITLGVASVAPFDRSLDATLIRADRALYRGKAGGRNRVVVDF